MGDHDRRVPETDSAPEETATPSPPAERQQPRGNAAAQEQLRLRSHPYRGPQTPAAAAQNAQGNGVTRALEQADRDGRGADYDALREEVDEVYEDPAPAGAVGSRRRGSLSANSTSATASLADEEFGADGSTQASRSASLRVERDSVRGGLGITSGRGNDRQSASGNLTVEGGPGRSGGAVETSIGTGRQTWTAGGGEVVALQPPTEIAGADGATSTWQVTGTITTSANAGASQSGTVGFGATGSGERTRTFTEHFSGENGREQAWDLYRNPDRAMGLAAMPDSVADLWEMDVGEARGNTSGFEAGATVSGEAMEVPLEVGLSTGASEGMSIQRTDDSTVQITVSADRSTSGELGAAVAGTGMGYSGGRTVRVVSTYRLHLLQDGADTAYAALQSGTVLDGGSGPGWERISHRVVHTDTSGMTAEVLGVALDGAESHDVDVLQDQRGTHRAETWRTDNVGVSTTALTRNDHALREGVAGVEHEDDFIVRNTVSRENLDLSEEALADISGGMDGHATGSGARSSIAEGRTGGVGGLIVDSLNQEEAGTWTVESAYTDGQMDAFSCATIERSQPPGSLPPRLHGDWETLQERLRADPDDQTALGEFLQVAGADGTRALHDVSGGPREQHVQLAHASGVDANFPGQAANAATGTRVRQLCQAATRDEVLQAGREATGLRRTLRGRLNAITARGAYPDLPGSLRGSEARRLEQWVSDLSVVIRERNALRAPEEGGRGDLQWANQEGNPVADQLAEVTGQSAEEVAQEEPDAVVTRLLMQLTTDFGALGDRRRDTHYLWEQHHTLHGNSSSTPQQRFTGGLTWLSGNAMNEGYSTMRLRMSGADSQYDVAQDNYTRACEQLHPSTIGAGPEAAAEALQITRNAQGFIRLARRQYDGVHQGLTTMMLQQRGRNPQVWGQPSN